MISGSGSEKRSGPEYIWKFSQVPLLTEGKQGAGVRGVRKIQLSTLSRLQSPNLSTTHSGVSQILAFNVPLDLSLFCSHQCLPPDSPLEKALDLACQFSSQIKAISLSLHFSIFVYRPESGEKKQNESQTEDIQRSSKIVPFFFFLVNIYLEAVVP